MSRKPKIRDAEILEFLRRVLKGRQLPHGEIEPLVWEEFKDRGVAKKGVGGAYRRVLYQHWPESDWFTFKEDVFVRSEGGLWSLKEDALHLVA